jgi:transcription elongation GreA/GreB family factor
MIKIVDILEKLEISREKAESKLKAKREEIGFADKPTESRYISSTRWDLENAIEMAEKELIRIDRNLKEVERLLKKRKVITSILVEIGSQVKVKINDKVFEFLITETSEDINIGLLPKTSVIGRNLYQKKIGEILEYESGTGKQKMVILDIN